MSTALTLPWLASLMQAFCSPNSDPYKAVSDLFGTVPLSNIPRPGDAGGWNVAEWRSWALANGFHEAERAKHGYTFVNSTFNRIRFGKSDSGGDFRSSMALATEIKRNVRQNYLTVAALCSHTVRLVERGDHTVSGVVDRNEFIAFVRNAANGGISDEALANLTNAVGASMANTEEVMRVARTIEREYNLSLKQAFARFMPREDADRVATLLKESPKFQVGVEELHQLVDVLDQLRGEEAMEKEAKRRQREERERQKESVQAMVQPSAPAQTAAQVHDNILAEQKRKLSQGVGTVMNASHQLYRTLQAMESLVLGMEFPHAVVADERRVAELEQQLAEAQVERDALRQVHAEQATSLAAAQQEVRDLTSLVNAPNPYKESYDQLLAHVEMLCGSTDFVETAGHIAALRALLKQNKKTAA